MLPQVLAAADLDSLRGIEGAAATAYFPQKTQKFYLFVKDPQVKLCIFAVAPSRGRGLKCPLANVKISVIRRPPRGGVD